MSVIEFTPWHRPGCSTQCSPRWHDLDSHEAWGAQQERERQRQRIIRTGPLTIDLDRRVATARGEDIPLSGREWELLAYLAQRLDEFCDSHEIRRAIWGRRVLDKNTARVLGARLRAKLGPDAHLIRSGTQHRGGMRLLKVESEP